MAKRVKRAVRGAGQSRKRASAASNAAPPAPPGAAAPAPAAQPPAAGIAAGSEASLTVRFYCQGIGDCHLLRFSRPGGPFWMLIDCGIHSSVSGGSDTIDKIVGDISGITKRLDVIVLTHEHWDHASGFHSAREKFQGFEVGEVWAAWTENSKDPQAVELDKFKDEGVTALQGASQRLDNAQGLSGHLSAVQKGLAAVLGFNFSVKGERVRTARNAFLALGQGRVKYLEPKSPPFDLQGNSGVPVPNVRVYVLGPPRDTGLLKVLERPSEMYSLGAGGRLLAAGLNSSFMVDEGFCPHESDANAPFDSVDGFEIRDFLPSTLTEPLPEAPATAESTSEDRPDAAVRARKEALEARARTARLLQECYDRKDQAWRRIDHDWLGVSADLAMQMDKRTNNSSLVLAFELLDTKRVLLFVGDAQVGNWLSWKDLSWQVGNAWVAGRDLLARTVFYKVGHHGSHNATLKQNGLELMTSPELAAFIPTNKDDAANVGWGEMPFEPLLEALNKRAKNRVVRADDMWLKQPGSQPLPTIASDAIAGWRHDTQNGLWVEFDFK